VGTRPGAVPITLVHETEDFDRQHREDTRHQVQEEWHITSQAVKVIKVHITTNSSSRSTRCKISMAITSLFQPSVRRHAIGRRTRLSISQRHHAYLVAAGLTQQLKLYARCISRDTHTKDTPIVIYGRPEQVADEKWSNLFKGKGRLASVPEGAGMPAEFGAMIQESFGGESPGASQRYAMSAAVLGALAETDTGNALFNWGALTETLAALVNADVPDTPPVRLNAMRALANIADAGAMDTLISFYGSSDNDELRAAAGMAVASICHATPQTLDDAAFETLLKGTQSDAIHVRVAAFAALGSANLTAAQSYACAKANRPGVGGGGADEDM